MNFSHTLPCSTEFRAAIGKRLQSKYFINFEIYQTFEHFRTQPYCHRELKSFAQKKEDFDVQL